MSRKDKVKDRYANVGRKDLGTEKRNKQISTRVKERYYDMFTAAAQEVEMSNSDYLIEILKLHFEDEDFS